jgi:replicative DNA helicase
MVEKKHAWKGQKEGFVQALEYMKGRREGKIRSIKTPWPKFNDASTDGIEWNTLTVIAGRSGAGKTLVKDNIVNNAFVLNKGEEFRILEFQFEMLARVTALREFSSVVNRSYKDLCSANGQLDDDTLIKCYDYAKIRVKYPIDVVETPMGVKELEEVIIDYMESHINTEGEVPKYVNTIITLDHSYLLKVNTGQSKQDMLYEFAETLTKLKRRYPIAFIILSQLNRNIDSPERNEDGRAGNHILSSDLMGADALLQHADVVVGLNRPGYFKIRYYGPDRYIIDDERVMVMHFLKCRNGDTRMSFFRGNFESMTVVEIPTPPKQEKRLNTK